MTYQPPFEPRWYQGEAQKRLDGKPAFALFMGMRTGKTKVILDEWGRALDAGENHDLLVTAPAGAYRTWEGEVQKHLPPELAERTLVATWESRKDDDQLRDVIRSTDPARPRAVLINTEAFSFGDRALTAGMEFMASRPVSMSVDESTTIKNPDSKRTKKVITLGRAAIQRRILSGLPTPRSPLDTYSQFDFLDPKILNCSAEFPEFLARYAIRRRVNFGGRWVKLVVGYRNLEHLRDLIQPYSYRISGKDAGISPKEYVPRYVELTDEQRRLYTDLKRKATAQLSTGEHVTALEVVTRMLRLHQLCCGHLVDEDGTIHEVPSNKLDELVTLIDEYEGKVIVWCSYNHDVQMIYDRLLKEFGPGTVARFWGGNALTREEDSRRFKSDAVCRVMIATPGSGGRGRTWSEAGLMIYFSNTDNLEHRDQSEERASSAEGSDPVTVVDLMCRGTVEEKIVQALRDKIDLAALITGDDYREWLI